MRTTVARLVTLALLLAACSPSESADSTTSSAPTSSTSSSSTSTSTSTTSTTIETGETSLINGLPVDVVTEIPDDIKAEPRGAVQNLMPGNHRYLVRRAGSPAVSGESDGKYGVSLLTSYAAADKSGSYWVYQAPSFSAVESAAIASGTPFESITEIPETLYPY